VSDELHARISRLGRQLSNWGRWGPADELGTLNHITTERRRAAAALVETGEAISLAIPLDESGPQPPFERRLNPRHVMLETGTDVRSGVQEGGVGGAGWADDMVTMALQAGTHWDSLAHCFHDQRMYNDRDCALVNANGAQANAITPACDRIIGRGVLADLGAVGSQPVKPGHPIGSELIRECLEREGVQPFAGDILLLRTGHMARFPAGKGWKGFTHSAEAGLDIEALPWINETKFAAVAADNWAVEVIADGANPAAVPLPVHAVAIVYMGLFLGEIFDLEALAATCREKRRYEFLLVATPLPFSRAVGAPVNPIAIF
jgi:kynurenine formamidase